MKQKGANTMPDDGYPRPPRVIFSAISPPGSAPSTLAASTLGGTTAPKSAAISCFYAVVNLDATIQIFRITNQEADFQSNLERTFPDPKENRLKYIPPVTDIAFSPDSRFLSWGRADGTIELYNIQENTLTMVTPLDC
jgi:WD40 repeat protein